MSADGWRPSSSRARLSATSGRSTNWIAENDPAAADRVMLDLTEAMGRLVDVPGIGHVRDDLGDPSLRAWTVHRYVIIYQPDADPLTIVRVLSGGGDIGAIFE